MTTECATCGTAYGEPIAPIASIFLLTAADRSHQALEYQLLRWLDDHWAKPSGRRVYQQINVAGPGNWTENYRIPDLVLLTTCRFQIDQNEYFDGGPDVVVETHDPGDESYEKLDFYFKLGVREVWIIDRDSKHPEVFETAGDGFKPRWPNDDGWVQSHIASCEIRIGPHDKLEIREIGCVEAAAELP
jgi:Uma2 family endonuclease